MNEEATLQPGDGDASVRGRRGFGRVYRRKWSRFWWIQYFAKGKILRESSGSEHRRDAVRLLRKRYAELGAGQVVATVAERTTFSDLIGFIRDDYRVNQRRSLERVEYSLKHLGALFGLDKAVDITSDRIARYIAERQEAGASPATIVQEVACLRRMFTLAIRAGKVAHKPHIPTIRPSLPRSGFFEPAEYEALMRELPKYLRPLVEFLYLTGWRLGETCPLKWSRVDFTAGVVRLEPGSTKNSEGREFPFSALPALESLLRRQREVTTALERELGQVIPHVFHNRGRPLRDFRKAWRAACRRAHLVGRIPHDFRRTAVRNLVRAGVPETVSMRLTGHKTRSIFDRYDITSGRDLREAVQKLASFHSSADTTRRVVTPPN